MTSRTAAKLARLSRRDPKDLLLLIEAGIALVVARVALRRVAMAKIVSWVKGPVPHQKNLGQNEIIERCRWAVTCFSRNAPVSLVCFPQALALHGMLRRRGIATQMLYGTARLEGKLAAHVWLRRDGVILVGGEVAPDFTVLDIWTPLDEALS